MLPHRHYSPCFGCAANKNLCHCRQNFFLMPVEYTSFSHSRMVPALQWDTVIMGRVSDWRVTVSKEINDNLSFEERDSKRMPHTFAMSKSSALRYFCHTHQSTTLSHVHFCDDFGFILRGGKKRLSTLGNQLKGTVICQIVNQVPALMRIMSIFASNYRVTWVFSHLPNSKPGVNARKGV